MNPIAQMLYQQNPLVQIIRPIYAAFQTSHDPIATLGQIANNDPRIQNAVNLIQQNGSVQQAVYSESRRQNIDPNMALNQARQIMQSLNMK